MNLNIGFDTDSANFYAREDVEISGKTKVFGIIGFPVEHSLSPIFQAEFFRQFEVDGVYVPFLVSPDKIREAMDGLLAIGVEGFNVTVPHKESVCEFVCRDADAEAIGAVNTVRRRDDGTWEGTNTDWRGIVGVLEGLSVDAGEGAALVFGAGGTARAVVHALAKAGTPTIYLCNRNPERLQALLTHARSQYERPRYASPNFVSVDWTESAVMEVVSSCRIVINTTSIGLGGNPDPFPFALAGEGVAVDAVYAPDGATPFCRAATGRIAIDGLSMLVAQGAESFAFWHTGKKPDRLTTLRWLENRLGRQLKAPMTRWEYA